MRSPSTWISARRALFTLAGALVLAPGAARSDDATAAVETASAESATEVADIDRLTAAAVRWRGLDPRGEMIVKNQDGDALRARLVELLDEELPPDVEPAVERLLVRFGLIPESLDLRGTYLDLLGEQVAGYFDPERGELVIVEGESAEAMGLPDDASDALKERVGEMVLVHEVAHYLQHGHFDLESLSDGGLFDDGLLARASLIEGDATLVMMNHLFGAEIERFPMVETMLDSMLADPDAMSDFAPGLGNEILDSVPAYLRETLVFPYLNGLGFALRVRQAGGQALLDHAFAADRPASSEQILHPEKWLGVRDVPVEIHLPDPSIVGADWQETLAGTWGELGVRLALQAGLDAEASDAAVAASEGWGGDRFALWSNGDEEAVVWVTEWDSRADAGEFTALAKRAFADWRVLAKGTRVSLHHGVPARRAKPVLAALRRADARRANASSLDLAALGIDPDDIPGTLSIDELMALSADPVFAELTEAGTESGEDSELDEAALREVAASIGIDDETSMEELLENPVVQDAIERMATATPETIDGADGSVVVEAIGMRFTPPADWERIDTAAVPDMPVPPSFMAMDHENGWVLVVLVTPLPGPVNLEAAAMGLRFGLQAAGFEGEGSEPFERSGRKGLLLASAGEEDGVEMAGQSYVFVVEGHLIVFQLQGAAASADRVQPGIDAALDSIRFD